MTLPIEHFLEAITNHLQINVHITQQSRRPRITLRQHAIDQMLRPDMILSKLHGELPRRTNHLHHIATHATVNHDDLDGIRRQVEHRFCSIKCHATFCQYLCAQRRILREHPEQYMLCANIWAARILRDHPRTLQTRSRRIC